MCAAILPTHTLVDVLFHLHLAVCEADCDVQIVVATPKIVVPGLEYEAELADLIGVRAAHVRRRRDRKIRDTASEAVESEGRDRDAVMKVVPNGARLELRHVPVVFALYSFCCVNRC